MSAEPIPFVYRVVMAISLPFLRWWGRLTVTGLETIPSGGAVVLIANHDSAWDPLAIGLAALPRRQVRALAKASLWKLRPVAKVLDGMGQVPIERGRGDASALRRAIEVLEEGGCIGVFPEGTISRGQVLRAQSGAGRLIIAAPGTVVVCARVRGTVDIVRFPRRPRVRVDFFRPAGGQCADGETAVSLAKRTLAEIRADAPPAISGRRGKAPEPRNAPVTDG
jgi:1-acyl-sn-glycerol-3-phosphate acyltransferase